jgi:hypothetical protein
MMIVIMIVINEKNASLFLAGRMEYLANAISYLQLKSGSSIQSEGVY